MARTVAELGELGAQVAVRDWNPRNAGSSGLDQCASVTQSVVWPIAILATWCDIWNNSPAKGTTLVSSHWVGLAGFEPATPCSQSRCADQAAPQPVLAPSVLGGRVGERSLFFIEQPCSGQPAFAAAMMCRGPIIGAPSLIASCNAVWQTCKARRTEWLIL